MCWLRGMSLKNAASPFTQSSARIVGIGLSNSSSSVKSSAISSTQQLR